MSAIEYRFIEPLDVLFLRGNKLFGDPGSYGECLIPPWPSVAAGAIRSRMLADDNVDLAAFGKSAVAHPTLGTPAQPGSFAVTVFQLARRTDKGVEILVAPPADLVVSEPERGQLTVSALAPQTLAMGLLTSSALPLLPVLAQDNKRIKPASGYWLTQAGWETYLKGETPTVEQLLHSSQLWAFDARVGIGMSSTTGSVEDGKLFSTQAVVMHKKGNHVGTDKDPGKQLIADYDVGFLAAVRGAMPPSDGLLRFGGDGRAATITSAIIKIPEPDYDTLCKARRCRIVLTSPGLFPDGWKLPGTDNEHRITLPGGIKARLASAAAPRAEVISGWDLAQWQPKPAQRVAPTGSVYWLDELDTTPQALRKLVECGLWSEPCEDAARRAEGFNRMAIAAWK